VLKAYRDKKVVGVFVRFVRRTCELRNSIIALDNLYQAENANAMQTKEAVAMQVVNYVLV
jgi:hypothetical protein